MMKYRGITQGYYTIHSCFGGVNEKFVASGSEGSCASYSSFSHATNPRALISLPFDSIDFEIMAMSNCPTSALKSLPPRRIRRYQSVHLQPQKGDAHRRPGRSFQNRELRVMEPTIPEHARIGFGRRNRAHLGTSAA